MTPAEKQEVIERMDRLHQDLKKVYDESADDLTEEFKKTTIELVLKWVTVAFLWGVLAGLVAGFVIEWVFSAS